MFVPGLNGTTQLVVKSHFSQHPQASCSYLCNKLDDFDKDVEGHVSGHHTTRSFREKCRNNGVEASGGGAEMTKKHFW